MRDIHQILKFLKTYHGKLCIRCYSEIWGIENEFHRLELVKNKPTLHILKINPELKIVDTENCEMCNEKR